MVLKSSFWSKLHYKNTPKNILDRFGHLSELWKLYYAVNIWTRDKWTKYCQKMSGVVLKSSFWSKLHFKSTPRWILDRFGHLSELWKLYYTVNIWTTDKWTKYCQKMSGVVLKSSFWSKLHFKNTPRWILDRFWPFVRTLKIVLYSKYLDYRQMDKILPEKHRSALKIFLLV